MTGRYEFDTPDYCRVLYRFAESSPHYKGGEFLDIYIKALCPACPEDQPQGMLVFTELDEIVADCPKCGYHARVSVYKEGIAVSKVSYCECEDCTFNGDGGCEAEFIDINDEGACATREVPE